MRQIKEYFSPKGRMARLEYFATMMAISALMYVPLTAGAFMAQSNEVLGMIMMFAGLGVAFWTQACVAAKRAHDMNWSGSTAALLFVPIANVVIGLILLFKAGTAEGEENKFDV